MGDESEGRAERAPEEVEIEATEGAESLLDLVLAEHEAEPRVEAEARIDGVVVGRLASIGEDGAPRVDFPGNHGAEPIAARAMIALGAAEIGREVALLFEQGDRRRPVVMGLMHAATAPQPGVEVDGGRVVLSAEKEIVLRCGDASITLTRAGKVLIRGAYVLSRASGVQRIQGGSVEIN